MQDSTLISFDHYRQKRAETQARAWRRARGLLSVRDLAETYRREHFIRHPAMLAPLPCDRREVSR